MDSTFSEDKYEALNYSITHKPSNVRFLVLSLFLTLKPWQTPFIFAPSLSFLSSCSKSNGELRTGEDAARGLRDDISSKTVCQRLAQVCSGFLDSDPRLTPLCSASEQNDDTANLLTK